MAELAPFEVSVFLLQLKVFGMSVSLVLVLVGAGLVVAEALAPGAHFIVAGVALLVAGLVGLILPPSLAAFTPFVLAALVIVTGGAALFVYRQFDFYGAERRAPSRADPGRGDGHRRRPRWRERHHRRIAGVNR